MMDEAFLTTEEVLEYLQVNLRTVYRLIKAGKIPAVRVGRQWRFRRSDVDAWLESQRANASEVKRCPARSRQITVSLRSMFPLKRMASRRMSSASGKRPETAFTSCRSNLAKGLSSF